MSSLVSLSSSLVLLSLSMLWKLPRRMDNGQSMTCHSLQLDASECAARQQWPRHCCRHCRRCCQDGNCQPDGVNVAPDISANSRWGKPLGPNASTHSLMSQSAKSWDNLQPLTGCCLLLLCPRRRLPDSNGGGRDTAASMGLESVATLEARRPHRNIGVDRTDVGTKPSTPPPLPPPPLPP